MHERRTMTFRQWAMLIVLAIGLWTGLNNMGQVIGILRKVIAMLLPLVIGGCIAFILNVPMSAMERGFAKLQIRRGKPVREKTNATVSLILTVLSFLLVLAFVSYIAIPQLVASFSGLGQKFNNFYINALVTLRGWGVDTTAIQEFVRDFDVLTIVAQLFDNTKLGDSVQVVLNTVVGTASTLISSVVMAFLGFIIALYLLAMKRKLGSQCVKIVYAYVKTSVADRIMRVAGIFYRTYASFISGQCLEACILGLMFYLVLGIFRFPYAATISVLIAVFALIPYVGAFLACAIGVLLILMESPMKALIFIGVFLVVQQVEGQLIYPRVVGKSVGLPPIWTLLAALVGANLMGVLGVLFFIPLTSVVYQLLREGVYTRLHRKHVSPETRANAAVRCKTPEEFARVRREQDRLSDQERQETAEEAEELWEEDPETVEKRAEADQGQD